MCAACWRPCPSALSAPVCGPGALALPLVQRPRHVVLVVLESAARASRSATHCGRPGSRNRCGIHTAEIELRGDDIGGIGVHIAARVSGLARARGGQASLTDVAPAAGAGSEIDDRTGREF